MSKSFTRRNEIDSKSQRKDPKLGLIQFNAQLSLLNSESVYIPLHFQQIMIIVKYGHLLSYLFNQNTSQMKSTSNAYTFMEQLARFCKNFNYFYLNGSFFRMFSYLIVTTYLIILITFVVFLYINFSKQQKKKRSLSVKDYLKNLDVRLTKIMNVLTYLNELVQGVLFVKMIQLCVVSIIDSIVSLAKNGIYFLNLFFSTLTTLVFLTYLFYSLTVSGETMNIYYNKNKIINLKSTDYWLLFFFFAFILLNESSGISSIVLYLNCLVLILIPCLNIWNIIKNLGFVNEKIVITKIIVLSYMASLSICSLFCFAQQKKSTTNLPLMTVLLSSLFSKQLIQYHRQQIKQFQLTHQLMHPKIVQFKISVQFQSTQVDQSQEIIFLNKIYLMGHKQYCQKPTCYCRVQSSDDRVLNTIQIDQVKTFNNSLVIFNETKNINSYLLHFLFSLNFIGFTNQALQQTNLIIQFLKVQTQKEYQSNDQDSCYDRDLRTMKQTSSSHSQSYEKDSNTSSAELLQTHSFEMIRPKFKLNFYQTNRLLMLMDIIKTQMNQNFLQNTIKLSDKTLSLATSVELFLLAENGNVKLKKKIIRAFQKKSMFLLTVSRSIGIKSSHLFNIAKELAYYYKKLETKLLKYYEIFPSQKMQSVNAFFQSEIMNNFLFANKLANITTISDEKLLKLQQNLIFNLLSNDVKYLIVKFEQKSEFQIAHRSNQIHEFFGYTYEGFQKVQNLLQLVPHGIKRGHPQLVQKYFTEGQSKFFRQVNMNLIALENDYVVPVDFFFDITFSDLNDMSFVSFFMKQSNNNSYLIVNSSQYITALSQNFYSMLNTYGLQNSKSKLKNMKALGYVRDIPIAFVLPDFKTICAKLLQSGNDKLDTFYRRYYNQDIVFLKQDCLYGFNQDSSTNLELSGRIKTLWNNKHNLIKYVANFSVYYKDIDDQASFYIFEFQDIKLNKDTMRYTSPPLQNNQIKYDLKILEINNFDNTLMSESIDDFHKESENHEQESIVEQIMTEQKVNKPSRHFQRRGEIKPTYALSRVEKHDDDFIRLKLSVDLQIQSQCENVEIEIGNNQTTQPILFTTTNGQHQKFFSSQQPKEISIDSWDAQSKQEQQQRDKDLSDYVLMQVRFQDNKQVDELQFDDSASQLGNISDFKGSKFYRKYELIDSIIKSQKRPNQFRLLLISYIFKYSISIIFLGLIFANVSNDMHRFLKEIDMLQIKFGILGPVNKFFLTQSSWAGYYIRSTILNQITFEEAQKLSQFSIHNIQSTYKDLRKEFTQQLSNPYLKDFFTDQNITIIQQGARNFTYYTVSLREALMEWVSVIYDYTVSIDWDGLNVGQLTGNEPFVGFTIANGITFETRFNNLVGQIQTFTLNRCDLVASKWYSTIIPFMVIIFIICLMQYRYYRNFIGHYERILHVFRLMEMSAIQKDLLRYGVLSEMLEKNGNLMFMYKFDLAQKENYLKLEDTKKDLSRVRRTFKKDAINQNIKINQPWLKSALVIGIIYLIFFIYAGLVLFLTQQYLGKYKDTTQFYFTLGNAGVAVCGAYTWKEQHYYYKIYPYLSQQDGEVMYSLFQLNLGIIAKFSDQLSQFQRYQSQLKSQQNDYLITAQFTSDLVDASTTDFCSFFPKQYQQIGSVFCNQSQNQVIKKGLISTLNKIHSDLQQEALINNLTYRSPENYPFKQFELPMLTYEMIYILVTKFRDGLQLITNEVINTIVIISIIYLIYATFKISYIFRNVRQYYDQEFSLVKRFLLLLPQHTIFLESHFEQAVHLMMVQDSIL